MNKTLENKICDKWIPSIKARYEAKGIAMPTEAKLKKIAKMAHVRKIYESGTAGLDSTVGRGAFSLGNDPSNIADGTKGSSEIFQNLFGVFVDSAAITFGMDLLPVLTMTKSNLNVHIAEPVYADGRIESASKKPLVFQVKLDITGAAAALVKGTTYTVKTANTGGENQMDVIYVGKHRINANAIFRVGQQYDNSGAAGTDWTAKTIGEILGTSGSAIYESAVIYNGFDATTADYVAGFTNNVAGYAGAGQDDTDDWHMNRNDGKALVKPMSRQTGERTYYRSMGLRTWHKNFSAETYHVDIEYTTEQIQDMKMDHDMDALELGDTILQDQLSQGMNDHILSYIFAAGWQNHFQMFDNNGFNLNAFLSDAGSTGSAQEFVTLDGTLKTIDGPSGVLPSTGAIAENLSSLQRRIITRMLYASAIANHRSRKGKGDTAVTNGTYSTAIRDVKGFQAAPFENNINSDAGLHMIGNFYGINTFEDPLMDLTDERISIFRHGNERDPGLKLCTYILAEKISTIAEGTMSAKEALKSRYTIAETGTYPELGYLTFTVQQDSGYAIV